MKEHAGAIFSLECRGIDNGSAKQKINLRSLTKAELISLDNKISKIV